MLYIKHVIKELDGSVNSIGSRLNIQDFVTTLVIVPLNSTCRSVLQCLLDAEPTSVQSTGVVIMVQLTLTPWTDAKRVGFEHMVLSIANFHLHAFGNDSTRIHTKDISIAPVSNATCQFFNQRHCLMHTACCLINELEVPCNTFMSFGSKCPAV